MIYGYACTFDTAVSSSITNITGKSVREGENVTLKCLAEGKPKPTITWTRLSDNRIATMPLIHISRHDQKAYRCTANNDVGIPATREVSIDVQCKCFVYLPSESSSDILIQIIVNKTIFKWLSGSGRCMEFCWFLCSVTFLVIPFTPTYHSENLLRSDSF